MIIQAEKGWRLVRIRPEHPFDVYESTVVFWSYDDGDQSPSMVPMVQNVATIDCCMGAALLAPGETQADHANEIEEFREKAKKNVAERASRALRGEPTEYDAEWHDATVYEQVPVQGSGLSIPSASVRDHIRRALAKHK